jgi:murein DD-endopeptidase MepM/ murein hydrolase activator NlpD
MPSRHARTRPALIVLAALTLAACARNDGPAPVVYRGQSSAAPAPAPAPAPATSAPAQTAAVNAAGVVDYGGYSAILARRGDTVETMAARVGLSASELASYNGLPSGYQPRAGDELILPPRPEGYSTTAVVAAPAASAVETAALDGGTSGGFEAAPDQAATNPTGFDLDRIEASLDEPAAQPSSAAAAPAPAATPAPAAPAPAAQPAAPAPAAEPATRVAAAPAAQPAPAAASARFVAPVDGTISRPYGSGGGDGVDFAAPAGAPVRAAGDGQVALVSESLGGYGTIVLIRHRDSLLTLYGRIDEVSVAKGDRVRQGDQIGVVAPGGDQGDSLHFEVREGVESVDPARYLAG